MSTSEVRSAKPRSADIAVRRFSIARKGYEPDEVEPFLREVADYLNRMEGELEWLRTRCEHLERRATSAQEAAYARLSRDFMDVVRRADEAATRVRADAEAQAQAEVTSAHREAARLLAAAAEQAEAILTEARAEAGRILRDGASAPAVNLETAPARQAAPAPAAASSAGDDRLDLDLEVSLSDLFGELG
jgi:cell division septum initiation protein DivIVA